MGIRTGFWVGLFALTEDAVDVLRESLVDGQEGLVASKDLGSTVVAGLGTAGAFSLWSEFAEKVISVSRKNQQEPGQPPPAPRV